MQLSYDMENNIANEAKSIFFKQKRIRYIKLRFQLSGIGGFFLRKI
jgi:hypothetical protein